MKVCRICLSKDGRLYHITSNGLHSLYHQLLGILKLEEDNMLPQWVCAECGLRLMSYNKLRQKSLRSHQILSDLLDRLTYLTEEDINKIDREKNELQSNLTYGVLDQGIVLEYEAEIDKTDQKPNLNEYIIDFEGIETSSLLKTENDSDDCHSKTAVSNTEFNSDCKSDVFSDDSSLSSDSSSTTDKLLKTLASSSLKSRDKKVRMNLRKKFDKYINSLDKLTNKKVKNYVKNKVKNDVKNKVKYYVKNIVDVKKVPLPTKLKTQDKKEKLDLKKNVDKINKRNNSKRVKNEVKSVKKRIRRPPKIVNGKVVKETHAHPIEDVFNIKTLTLEEQLAEFNSRQYSKSYTDAPFKCGDCFNGFYTEVAFSKHMLTHSDEVGLIECKICKTRIRTKKRYYIHMIAHKTIFSCKECSFVTRMRAIARMHRLKHKGKVYVCPHCDLEFVNNNTYMLHLRVKHVTDAVCEFCGYSFVNARGVFMHKSLKHADEKGKEILSTDDTTCLTCKIGFASSKALETHLKISHLQQQPNNVHSRPFELAESKRIICEICGVKTSGSKTYKNHFRLNHPDNRPTQLPKRAKQAAQRRQSGQQRQLAQPWVCELCGQVFQNKSYLKTHALKHTGERPFECDHCHKTFLTKGAVQKHIINLHLPKKYHDRRPAPERWYPCGVCGKQFNHKNNMKRHLVVHTGLRPFICQICGTSFKTKGDVQTHTTHVHLKKPWPKKKEQGSRQAYYT